MRYRIGFAKNNTKKFEKNTTSYIIVFNMKSSRELALTLLEQGKSQSDIATIAGVTQATISRLINGKTADLSYRQGKRLEEAVRVGKVGKMGL
ncbi:helix-turn-helix domain-containing protein [Undibacterium sp. TJN19]|uniref:helix-turn-helix domain-containing protein n=1 Tax=Undibacterium sp. TJN19 TaxID=3413055 RepID=UPI003BEFD6AB